MTLSPLERHDAHEALQEACRRRDWVRARAGLLPWWAWRRRRLLARRADDALEDAGFHAMRLLRDDQARAVAAITGHQGGAAT